jgi:hypothetical protein
LGTPAKAVSYLSLGVWTKKTQKTQKLFNNSFVLAENWIELKLEIVRLFYTCRTCTLDLTLNSCTYGKLVHFGFFGGSPADDSPGIDLCPDYGTISDFPFFWQSQESGWMEEDLAQLYPF